MKPQPIHRSATKEQQILVEQAREEARAEGIDIGIAISADFLESTGDHIGAQRLREAKIVEAGESGK